MLRLQIDKDVHHDLRQLTLPVAQKIVATLELIRDDHDLLECLLQHGYGRDLDAKIQVSRWQSQWQTGRDLWRLKDWDLEGRGLRYRVIYGYAISERCIYVLGVTHRDFNYDDNHPFTQRVVRRYEQLCVQQ